MKTPGTNGLTQLTPRQALICAAVTGWDGDEPCSWPWPVPASDIAAWGRSHLPRMSEVEAEEAFQLLVQDGLFLRICYPIFKRSYFACWYESAFLRELPEHWTFPGWQSGEHLSIQDVSNFWDDLQSKTTDQYGAAFVWWGICAGQGSQSGDSGWGPCLGPSCSWYTDDKNTECHHGLEFVRMPGVLLPDMGVLHSVYWPEVSDDERTRAMDAAIVALRKVDSSLPCRTSDECDAAWKRRPT